MKKLCKIHKGFKLDVFTWQLFILTRVHPLGPGMRAEFWNALYSTISTKSLPKPMHIKTTVFSVLYCFISRMRCFHVMFLDDNCFCVLYAPINIHLPKLHLTVSYECEFFISIWNGIYRWSAKFKNQIIDPCNSPIDHHRVIHNSQETSL